MSFFNGLIVACEQHAGTVCVGAAPPATTTATGDKWIGKAVLKRKLTKNQLTAIKRFFEAEQE